jgi:hypothetical protein
MRVALLLIVIGGGVARADGLTLLAGGQYNSGRFGELYTWGLAFGLEANLQPSVVGLVWTMWATYMYSVPSAMDVSGSYNSFEMTFGPRFRLPLKRKDVATAVPAYVFVDPVLEILRTTQPVPPSNAQAFVGPAVSVGATVEPWKHWTFGLRAAFGIIGFGGPSSVKLLLSVGYGG